MQWDYITFGHRLNHEQRLAITPSGIRRLKRTLREVESHLTFTLNDPDEDGWVALLRVYESSVATAGEKCGSSMTADAGGR